MELKGDDDLEKDEKVGCVLPFAIVLSDSSFFAVANADGFDE
jgi:hypothetical protein